jgi:hypothetical protein
VAVLAGGCVATRQARETTTSGFLGDYRQLQPGGDGEALLIYRNPKADMANYKSIVIEPIRIYASADSALRKASPAELQGMVDYLAAAVRTELMKDYTLVSAPRPDSMRLRIAITEAQGSRVLLDTMSNILPPALAVSALKAAVTGKATAVGTARVEMELKDVTTNTRLMAAVDERVGGKSFEGKFDKWDDVKQAFDYWAGRLGARLAQERARK